MTRAMVGTTQARARAEVAAEVERKAEAHAMREETGARDRLEEAGAWAERMATRSLAFLKRRTSGVIPFCCYLGVNLRIFLFTFLFCSFFLSFLGPIHGSFLKVIPVQKKELLSNSLRKENPVPFWAKKKELKKGTYTLGAMGFRERMYGSIF